MYKNNIKTTIYLLKTCKWWTLKVDKKTKFKKRRLKDVLSLGGKIIISKVPELPLFTKTELRHINCGISVRYVVKNQNKKDGH